MTRRRPGLTLIEVLVVAFVVFLVAGALVMFLFRSQQGARRAHCMNNLRILGEAIYYFEGSAESLKAVGLPPKARGAAQGTLPPARIADGYATWAVQIAPYLASKNPLADWDLRNLYVKQPENARHALLAELFCPARDREFKVSQRGDVTAGGEHRAGAVADYACAAGTGDPNHDWTGPDADGAIILGEVLETDGDLILRWRSRTSFGALQRGRSNTILLGEKHV